MPNFHLKLTIKVELNGTRLPRSNEISNEAQIKLKWPTVNVPIERNGFLSFLCKLRLMLFHSFHSGVISIISIKPGRLYSGWSTPWNPSNLSFLSRCGIPKTHPLNISFLSGYRTLQIFHFFQGAGSLKLFISFI